MSAPIKDYWKNKTLLALDVSTWSTGWALWNRNQMTNGAIQPPREMTVLWERIVFQARHVSHLLFTHAVNTPIYLVLEAGIAKRRRIKVQKQITNYFTGRVDYINHEDKPMETKTLMALAEVRGGLIATINDLAAVIEVAPTTWKSYFGCIWKGSSGDEEKAAAHRMMERLWGITVPITINQRNKKTFDASDALAVLTYTLLAPNMEEK